MLRSFAVLRSSDLAWLATTFGLVTAVLYRVTFLADRQLFRDEAASWLESSYTLPDLLRHAASEPYPPLYALLLSGWMRVFGDGEAALRGLSVVCGLAVVVVGWRWAHEALGRVAGTVALVVLALSPLLLSNARDARMYALETGFAAIAWWLIWRLLSGRARDREGRLWHAAGLAVAVAGQLWTLAYGLPLAALQGLLVVVLLLRPGSLAGDGAQWGTVRRNAGWALAGLAVAGLSFLPWLPRTLAAATNGQPYWTPTPGWFDWALTAGTMMVGWRMDQPPFLAAALSVLVVALLGAAALLRSRDVDRRLLGWCAILGAALVLVVWAISLVRSTYDTRYFGAAVVPLAIALAAGVEALATAAARRVVPPPLARVVLTLLLGLVLLRGADVWLDDWRNDRYVAPVRQLVGELTERVRPGDVLVAVDARSYFPVAYQLHRLAQEGRALPAPLVTWDSGHEPFYRAQTLLEEEHIVRSDLAGERGWQASLPQLGPEGRLWLLVVANGRNPSIDFDPIEAGELRETERIMVVAPTEVSQIRRLELP